MKTTIAGAFAALGLVAGCQAGERTADRARQDIGRDAREAEKDVSDARKDYMETLRQEERSGNPVDIDGTVTSVSDRAVTVQIVNGDTTDLDIVGTTRLTRGGTPIVVSDITPGSVVHVTYRLAGGRRAIETIQVNPAATEPQGPGIGTH